MGKYSALQMSETYVCPLAELPSGTGFAVTSSNNLSIAVFNSGGTIYAVQNECPHAWAPLADGTLEGHKLTCSLHNWAFDVRNGEPLNAPPNSCLRTFSTAVRNGQIYVLTPDS